MWVNWIDLYKSTFLPQVAENIEWTVETEA